jgi:hypothetical protein
LSDSSFAPPASQLGTPNVGTLQVAAYPTAGQGLALDSNGKIPASLLSTGLHVIDDVTVTGSALASYDTNTRLGGNITSIFKDLLLVVQARSTTAATNDTLNLRFNNDSGANYDVEEQHASAGTVGSSEAVAATQAFQANTVPAASVAAGIFSQTSIEIANYTGTTAQKTVNTRHSGKTGTASGNITVSQVSAFWRSTAAITRLSLFLTLGSFELGTRITLYGRG